MKKPIAWIGPDAPSDEPEEEIASRGDAKRATRAREDALERLARNLAELTPARLERLELPEEVLDEVLSLQAIKAGPARNRQLRLVRSALREVDWSRIQARHDALLKHGVIPAALASDAPSAASEAPAWVARLLGEGAAGIEALVARAPTADRTHLRTLVQQVHKASAERRQRAEERLTQAVKSALR